MQYKNGLPVVTVPLPSRMESCDFTLKPISHTVGDFLSCIQEEDSGIDRVSVYNEGIQNIFHLFNICMFDI